PPMEQDARAGLPPVAETSTPSAWAPGERSKPSRKGFQFGLTAAVAVLVVAIGVGASRLLGGGPPGAATPGGSPRRPAPPRGAAPEVALRLTIEPSDAIVEIDGAAVKGSTVHLPKDDRVHKLVVRANGYATESRDLSAQADMSITLSLKPQKESAKAVSA